MNYILVFILSLILSFSLTGLLRRIGLRLGIVSKPRPRDIHLKPVPRIGGLAIFFAFIIASLAAFLVIQKTDVQIDKHIIGIWAGSFIIAFSMFFDDLASLKVWQKLFFQFAAVLCIIASGVGINSIANPFGGEFNLNAVYIPIITIKGITYHFSLFSDLLTLIWLVGMMNVINFVDGIDGLASGQSLIAALTIFILALRIGQPETALLSIILGGAALGFLIWNFPPAKIFMGDSGSMFLGFTLGALTIISGGKLATVFLVLGFPIVDGLIVVASRIKRRENPFTTPDKTHLHHRFLEAGFSQRMAIVTLYFISIAFAWVALRSTTLNKVIASLVLVILVIVLSLVLRSIRNKRSNNLMDVGR